MQRLAKYKSPVHYQYSNHKIRYWIVFAANMVSLLSFCTVFVRNQQITEVEGCSDNTHPIQATK
jgi:hypothetical protein